LTSNNRVLYGGNMKKKKNPHAVALGKLGGLVKAPKGLARMDPDKQRKIAAMGGRARWRKERAK